ncbi:hypothetical protein PQX77_009764 [Marasmius sp. AFHP31]|nr:hypothetical protein PQX77_009764 [Marasmius sp. AFHP31]
MSCPPPLSVDEIRNHTVLGIACKTAVPCTLELEEVWGRSPAIKFERWRTRICCAVRPRLKSIALKKEYDLLFNMVAECDRDALLNASLSKQELERDISAIERLPLELIREIVLYLPKTEDYFVLGMVNSFFHLYLYSAGNIALLWRPKRVAAGYREPMGGMSELDWTVLLMSQCCDLCYSDWDVRLLWDKQMLLGMCCVVGTREREGEEMGDYDSEFMKEVEGPGIRRNPPFTHYDDRYFFSDLDNLVESFDKTLPNERAAFLQRAREDLARMLAEQHRIANGV